MVNLPGLLQKIMDKIAPKNPAEYRASLFTEADLPKFEPYTNATERWDYFDTQGSKFLGLFAYAQNQLTVKRTRFIETLTDEDFLAAAESAADVAKYTALNEAHSVSRMLADGSMAQIAFDREHPDLAPQLAGILEWMAERYQAEIDRVRPLEEARLGRERADLQNYGLDENSAEPIEQRSKALRSMLDFRTGLQKDIDRLRGVNTPHPESLAAINNPLRPLAVAATYINPVLQFLA